MEQLTVISVVRDEAMYSRCVSQNPFFEGCSFVRIDNAQENLPIGIRYNQFMDNGLPEGWLVFCHEDWRPLQNMSEVLSDLDSGYLYGPIGKTFIRGRHRDYHITVGRIHQCRKDGSGLKRFGNRPLSGIVDTFDCQCLIVHSSLIAKYGLRFDEKLRFDLYVEDFCVAARTSFGVQSRVIPIKCCHYSGGNVGDAYYESLAYLKEKYLGVVDKPYACIAGNGSSIGPAIPVKKSGHFRFLLDTLMKIMWN